MSLSIRHMCAAAAAYSRKQFVTIRWALSSDPLSGYADQYHPAVKRNAQNIIA